MSKKKDNVQELLLQTKLSFGGTVTLFRKNRTFILEKAHINGPYAATWDYFDDIEDAYRNYEIVIEAYKEFV